MSTRRPKEKPTDANQDFTTRSIMALVMESAEMAESMRRFTAVVSALAAAHGVSTKV